MKVFVRKSFKENKSYHWYISSLPTVSQYFGKFSCRNSTIDNRQSSWLISMSTYSQRFRMMLAKIERHVQKCDEMWWNEILSRIIPCYYFCIIFNKSSLKNIYIFLKVRFLITIHYLGCVFFTCNNNSRFVTTSFENRKWSWFSCQIILEDFEWFVAEIERNEIIEMNSWILEVKSACY